MNHFFDKNEPYKLPDIKGRFGEFGGKYVPETLMSALTELETAFNQAWEDENFLNDLYSLMKN